MYYCFYEVYNTVQNEEFSARLIYRTVFESTEIKNVKIIP